MDELALGRRRVRRRGLTRRRGEGACEPIARHLGDEGVVRRYHLGAVGHVDLVSVVGRGVVARGDHDAGRRAEVLDGKGRQGCRQRTGEGVHPYPGPGCDRSDVAGELV